MKEIDVSECCYYDAENAPFCCELYENECEVQNCYFQQLQQLKQENEELKRDNSTLKDILSYPKYTNENAYNELLKLSKAELIKDLIESHQHGESTSQIVYRKLKEENKKYKQCLDEIEDITTVGYEGFCPKCSRKDCEDNNCYETAIIDILQKIKEVKGNE